VGPDGKQVTLAEALFVNWLLYFRYINVFHFLAFYSALFFGSFIAFCFDVNWIFCFLHLLFCGDFFDIFQ